MPVAPTIFVVDDEPLIATRLAMILNQSGFWATAFASPEDAIQAAGSESPSMLISDVNVPRMNGVDLAIRFKRLAAWCKVPLFSGHLATGELLDEARL